MRERERDRARESERQTYSWRFSQRQIQSSKDKKIEGPGRSRLRSKIIGGRWVWGNCKGILQFTYGESVKERLPVDAKTTAPVNVTKLTGWNCRGKFASLISVILLLGNGLEKSKKKHEGTGPLYKHGV